MKIDFLPRLQMGIGENPVGGAASGAAGTTPWGAIGQTAVGLAQTVGGWIQQRKATKALEKLQSPTYTQNKSILDFYNKALAKYNVNPYNTDLYRMQEQQANRGMASGLGALQGRGMALAGVNNLVSKRNDSLLQAGATAEQQQAQALSQLGQAAGMKTSEDQRAFDINQYQPFERKYNLLAQKAAGGNQVANSGISNVFGGLQSYDQMKMLGKMYGSDKGGGSVPFGSGSMGAAEYGYNVLQNLKKNQGYRVGK